MAEKNPKNLPPADRPLECGECKKTITVRYTEIVGDTITHTNMCADCPELLRRLHGISPSEQIYGLTGQAGLACGNCGTTLEDVRRGHRLGCMECYEVFGDVIFMELQSTSRLPARLLTSKKTVPLHLGRAPGETHTISPSSRLLALNEALKETLSREDYEQAAWLRDQIKALTEESPSSQDKAEDQGKPDAQ